MFVQISKGGSLLLPNSVPEILCWSQQKKMAPKDFKMDSRKDILMDSVFKDSKFGSKKGYKRRRWVQSWFQRISKHFQSCFYFDSKGFQIRYQKWPQQKSPKDFKMGSRIDSLFKIFWDWWTVPKTKVGSKGFQIWFQKCYIGDNRRRRL